jgi:hypothetical protein
MLRAQLVHLLLDVFLLAIDPSVILVEFLALACRVGADLFHLGLELLDLGFLLVLHGEQTCLELLHLLVGGRNVGSKFFLLVVRATEDGSVLTTFRGDALRPLSHVGFERLANLLDRLLGTEPRQLFEGRGFGLGRGGIATGLCGISLRLRCRGELRLPRVPLQHQTNKQADRQDRQDDDEGLQPLVLS